MSYCYWLQVGQMPCCACSRCRNGQFDYILLLMSCRSIWTISYTIGWLFWGLTALWDSISVYIGPSPRERGRKKSEMIDERKKMSKQPPPAPTARAVGPRPTLIQISRTYPALEVYPAPSHHPTTPYIIY